MQLLDASPAIGAEIVYPLHDMPMLPDTEPQDPELRGPSRDQRALRREFSKALAGNDFALRFQPRYRIATSRLGAVDGVVRWQHRRRGVIPEQILMALAEKARIADEVHRWAIMEGARTLSRLPRGLRFGMTVPPFLLRGTALADSVDMAVEECGITPEQLELTISETTLSALDDAALMILAGLFDEGVSIVLGQFGATLGSLTLLARIPLDCVKIDASLVRGLPHDPESNAIIRAVVEVAHAMGARVVAQGVETEEQRKALARLRCDEAQGGLFGPAMSAAELRRQAR